MSSKRALRGVPSACHWTGSAMAVSLLTGRHVALCHVRAAAEEVVLHLPAQVVARALVREIQAVLVDQHRLLLEPLRPGFLAHVLVDALAELARIGRKIEAFGFAAELDAVDGSGHDRLLVLISLCG